MASKHGWLWTVGLSAAMGPPSLMRREESLSAATEPAPQPKAQKKTAPKEAAPAPEGEYRGNVKSMAFHQPGCRYYDGADCTASFADRDQAEEAGYKPCKVCKP